MIGILLLQLISRNIDELFYLMAKNLKKYKIIYENIDFILKMFIKITIKNGKKNNFSYFF